MVVGDTRVSPSSDVPVADGERPAALDPPTEDAIGSDRIDSARLASARIDSANSAV
jgi:hypothetical protein